jgi:ABC-type transporter Mla subunit MlaD
MSMKAKKIRIGVFLGVTLGGLLWLVWMLGAQDMFAQKIQAVTQFDESVSGLSIGSSVRYRGLLCGQVRKLQRAPDGKQIQVLMEIDVASLGFPNAETARAFLNTQLRPDEKGRRLLASQTFNSVATGVRSVQLDMGDNIAVDFVSKDPKVISIPSGRSMMQQFGDIADEILQDLRKVRFAEIGKNLNSAVVKIDGLLADERIGKVLDNAVATSANLKTLSSRFETTFSPEKLAQVGKTLDHFDKAAADLASVAADLKKLMDDPATKQALTDTQSLPARILEVVERADKLIGGLDTQVANANLGQLSTELKGAATKVGSMAGAVEQTASGLGESRAAVLRTAGELDRTLQELRQLLNRINDAAELPGKKKE